jgi:hypothetical protein
MPPEIPPTPLPTDRGKSARQFLESEGLIARIPSIRSSDYGSALTDPFGYYLRRRLGLTPALMYSEALSRGSYFHTLFALYDRGDRWQIFQRQCAVRLAEINRICKDLRISENARAEAVQNEQTDQALASAWFKAFEELPCIKGKSALQFLDSSYTKIGAELRLTWVDERFPRCRQVAQFDLLLLDRRTNRLWIVDAKTTSAPPLIRLSTVREEFQTMHYFHALEWVLERGVLQKRFDLPDDVSIGGMMHMAVLKPSIVFGQSDRDFHLESEGKRSGVSGRIIRTPVNLRDQGTHVIQWTAGQPYPEPFCGTVDECLAELHERTGKKPEKVYRGEPTLSNYAARCMRWYMGQDEYTDKAPDFENDPPINISYTHSSVGLDNDWRSDYLTRVAMIYKLATTEANPCNFLKNIDSIRMGNRLAHYSPFYLTEPKDWPSLVQSQQFLVAHRDAAELPEVPEPHEFDGLVESLEPELQC